MFFRYTTAAMSVTTPWTSLLFFLATVSLALVSVQHQAVTAGERPNIVFILVDDLAWSDLGCYGHSWHRTPHIDRLASEGVRFTNGYAPAPICSASRASILTGKTVARLQFEFVTKNKPGVQMIEGATSLVAPPLTLDLPVSEITLAEAIGEAGYETAFFGKWHVARHYNGIYNRWHPDYGPRKQGFETAIEDFGEHPYGWSKREKLAPEPTPAGQFADDAMIKHVTDFIRQDHQKPYFVMVSSFYVHTPVLNRAKWLVREYEKIVPQDVTNRSNRVRYAAFLETLDHHVGQVLDATEEAGNAEETVVLFWSDNGGHPLFTANAPLRGSKWNLYEGGIRVPAIMKYPQRIQEDSICHSPVIGYDIFPTLVNIARGQSREPDPQCDGGDFLPLVAKPTNQDADTPLSDLKRPMVWHFPYYHPERGYGHAIESIGIDDFAVSKTRPQSAMRVGPHKLVHFAEDDRIELYDLAKDPSEQNDLREVDPKLAEELAFQLQAMLKQMSARFARSK